MSQICDEDETATNAGTVSRFGYGVIISANDAFCSSLLLTVSERGYYLRYLDAKSAGVQEMGLSKASWTKKEPAVDNAE